MTELRQRRGAAEVKCTGCGQPFGEVEKFCSECGTKRSTGGGEGAAPVSVNPQDDRVAPAPGDRQPDPQALERVKELMEQAVPPKPKPGLSHSAKAAKEQLEADPYNMFLIFQLGAQYYEDLHYNRCANVMIRGWKRLNEFDNPEMRYEFGLVLFHASYKVEKYQQALAVFKDLEAPTDPDGLRKHTIYACQVYCANNMTQEGLKAFCDVVNMVKKLDNKEETMIALWGTMHGSLKKAGSYDAAKAFMEKQFDDDHYMEKLKSMEVLFKMRDDYADAAKEGSIFQKYCVQIVIVSIMVFMYLLYLLESSSLAKLQIGNK